MLRLLFFALIRLCINIQNKILTDCVNFVKKSEEKGCFFEKSVILLTTSIIK